MRSILFGASAVALAEAGTLKLAWKDCGGGTTPGTVTGLAPTSLSLGAKTTVTGSGSTTQAVSAGTFEIDLKASIISQKYTGDLCSAKSFNLPLGTGTIAWDGVKCPIAAGHVDIPVDITLSSSLPAALQSVELTISGADTSATKLLCMQINTSPARHRKGFKRSPFASNMEVAEITKEDIANAPDALDWSQKGATSPVKDQGDCGSCWAFSTTEGVESAVFMSTGKLPVLLSTQELVSCEKQDDGCDGGDIPEAVTYLKKNGMASESDYPDTSSRSGKTGKCKWNKQAAAKVTGMKYAIPPCESGNCAKQDEAALAAALAKNGPLSICVNSGDGQSGDWENYQGGVLKGSCKAKASLMDHCVQLVGYDKSASTPYWKIRNSWATDFGEEGFIRIPYGKKNTCCVGCEAVIISATNEAAEIVV